MRVLFLFVIFVLLVFLCAYLQEVNKPEPVKCSPCAECACKDCSKEVKAYKELAESCINEKQKVKSR